MTIATKNIKLLQRITSIAFHISTMWLVCTLMLPIDIKRPALYAFFISFGIDWLMNMRWKNWRWTSEKWIFLAWVIFFALFPLYRIATGSDATPIYNRMRNACMPFVGLGLMGLLGMGKIRLKYIGYAFIITAVTTIGYIACSLPEVAFRSFEDLTWHLNQIRIEKVHAHMLFNLYMNCSLMMGIYILSDRTVRKWVKYLVGTATLAIFAIVFLSDGRVGFATVNIILVAFALVEIWRRYKRAFVPSVITLAIALCAVIWLHPRVENAPEDPRLSIWKVTMQTIEERPILGYGVAAGRERFIENGANDAEFVAHYMSPFITDNPKANPSMMHPHNALLDSWLSFGLFGLLLMVFILVAPLIIFGMQHNIYGMGFAMAFGLQAMFESWGAHLMPLLYTIGIVLWYYGFDRYKKTQKTKN